MTLTATIRDERGMVLCAYTLKPVGEGTRRMVGHDALELEGVRYLVATTLTAGTPPDVDELPF